MVAPGDEGSHDGDGDRDDGDRVTEGRIEGPCQGREGGEEGIREFCDMKVVATPTPSLGGL